MYSFNGLLDGLNKSSKFLLVDLSHSAFLITKLPMHKNAPKRTKIAEVTKKLEVSFPVAAISSISSGSGVGSGVGSGGGSWVVGADVVTGVEESEEY